MSRKKNKNKNLSQDSVNAEPNAEETLVFGASLPEEEVVEEVAQEEAVVQEEAPVVTEEPVAAEPVAEPEVVETIAPKEEVVQPEPPAEIDNLVDDRAVPPPPKTKFVLERKGFDCHMYLRCVDETGKTYYTENADGAMFEKDKETAHRVFNSLVEGLKAQGIVAADAVFEIVAV